MTPSDPPVRPPEVRMLRDLMGAVRSVEGPVEELLGWQPGELVGMSSASLIHPDDEASAVVAWLAMLTAGSKRIWRGRYRTSAGAWTWVEAENTPVPGSESVATVMRPLSQASLAAELEGQSRRQVLTKLADALPVGVFEIDLERRFRFTNDRLHVVLGAEPAATLGAQLAGVVPEDRSLLETVLDHAFEGSSIDDVELHVRPTSPQEPGGERVLSLSLRPLLDPDGRVYGAVGSLSDVTDRAQARHRLEVRASRDGLTGCLNHTSTMELLSRTLADPRTRGRGVAVVFVDLDDLKLVNDRYGHQAGDALLRATGDRLAGAVRDCDRVGRVGGDEFLVVCPEVRGTAEAQSIARRVERAICGTVDLGSVSAELRASVGYAWSDGALDADVLVAEADAAMYRAKRSARRPAPRR